MRNGAFDYKLERDRDPEFKLRVVDRPADAGTPGGMDDQEAQQRSADREEQIFWRETLRNPAGRRAMTKILRLAGAFETSPFAADMSGRLQDRLSDYKLGQMSVGHMLYQLLAICARNELFALQDEINLHCELAVRPGKGSDAG
jgi:hypothetical protein